MQPIKDKKELLALTNTDEIIKLEGERGARITPRQAEFLKNALYEGYRHAMGRHPRAMTPRERNLKKTVFDNLRSSMADLTSYFHVTRTVYQVPTWLRPRDIHRAIPKEWVVELVEGFCATFGHEYADPILAALQGFYQHEGERIQIVREPAGYAFAR